MLTLQVPSWLLICAIGVAGFNTLACPIGIAQQVTIQSANVDDQFQFTDIAAPSKTDAGNQAKWTVIGPVDRNSSSVKTLSDGKLPQQQDEPQRNFFFGRTGGKLLIDLGESTDVQQINTYSWHPNTRNDQHFKVWVSEDESQLKLEDIAEQLKASNELANWKVLAEVDTRNETRSQGRPLAASVRGNDDAVLTHSRFLVLEIFTPMVDNPQSNTFFSEIDIVDGKQHEPSIGISQVDSIITAGDVEIVFDTSDLPEIREWVNQTLKPACRTWYPKIAEMLPSDNFQPPKKFTIYFHSKMDGVAYTQGKDVHCAGVWFMRNLNGEAAGAVVHELVHVIQQYRGGRRRNRNPGWMVEGVADYIRWFHYEPVENKPKPDFRRANYNDSYRTSAAFLDFVIRKHDKELLQKFNAAMREGKYSEDLWKEWTGKDPVELWQDFKDSPTREPNDRP